MGETFRIKQEPEAGKCHVDPCDRVAEPDMGVRLTLHAGDQRAIPMCRRHLDMVKQNKVAHYDMGNDEIIEATPELNRKEFSALIALMQATDSPVTLDTRQARNLAGCVYDLDITAKTARQINIVMQPVIGAVHQQYREHQLKSGVGTCLCQFCQQVRPSLMALGLLEKSDQEDEKPKLGIVQ